MGSGSHKKALDSGSHCIVGGPKYVISVEKQRSEGSNQESRIQKTMGGAQYAASG